MFRRKPAHLMLPGYFFLAYFITEMLILASVIRWLGFFNTLFLLILTTVFGSWIVRSLGFKTLRRQGLPKQLPKRLLAGILLLIPGFLTDFIGLLLLILPIKGHFAGAFSEKDFQQSSTSHDNRKKTKNDQIIEGECWRQDD